MLKTWLTRPRRWDFLKNLSSLFLSVTEMCPASTLDCRRTTISHLTTSTTVIFHPAAEPLSGGVGRPKFNQLESDWMSLPIPTNPVCWGSMHALSRFYYGNRPIHTHSPTHKQKKKRLQYTAPQLAHSVKMNRCSHLYARIPYNKHYVSK